MSGYRLAVSVRKIVTLVLCIGVLPFLFSRAYAGDKVGLTYGAKATVQSTYVWRGFHVGDLNLQASANVGYGGLYFDAWCNIGTADWSFKHFQPEVDLSLGFRRWGLDAGVIFIHNFNCPFFDFSNHPFPQGGNALELDVRYTVSERIPLSFLWATRVSAADGYLNAAGDTIRAYSSFAQISYQWNLRDGYSIYTAIGFTPWRSLYTRYEKQFAVNHLELRVRKDWTLAERCGMGLFGQMVVNPTSALQPMILNLGINVYLK